MKCEAKQIQFMFGLFKKRPCNKTDAVVAITTVEWVNERSRKRFQVTWQLLTFENKFYSVSKKCYYHIVSV